MHSFAPALSLVLLLAAIAAPSVNTAVLNGLPFDTPFEVLAGLALLPLVLSAANRRLWRTLTPPRVHRAMLAGTLAVLVLKLGLSMWGSDGGFLACYATPADPSAVGTCQRSYAAPLSAWTRVDRTLAFGESDWNLAFFNQRAFNFYNFGEPSRTWMPFVASWKGALNGAAARLHVEYTGEGVISVGGTQQVLPGNYGEIAALELPLPAGGDRTFHATYTYDDGYRIGMRGGHPYATFRLTAYDGRGDVVPLAAAPVRLQQAASRLADLLLALMLACLTACYARSLGRSRRGAMAAALVGLAGVALALLPFDQALLARTGFAAACLLVLAVLSGPAPRRAFWAGWPLLVVLALLLPDLGAPRYEAVRLMGGGTDPLTYESFARDILTSGSLRAGEDWFYYQPLYRYLRFLEHLLLGDGQTLITMVTHAVWIGTTLWAYARLRPARQAPPAVRGLAALCGVACLALIMTPQWRSYLAEGLSEYWTWLLLPLAVGGIGGRARPSTPAVAYLAAALSVVTRFNQGPALAALAGVSLLQSPRARRHGLMAAVVFGLVVVLLPLWHNYHFAGVLTFLPRSADIPENLVVSPSELLTPSPDTWTRLLYQARGMAGLSNGMVTATFALWGLGAVWAATLALLASRRAFTLRTAALMAVPLCYLGVHVLYQVALRHVTAGYLSMGLVSLAALGAVPAPSRAPAAPASAGAETPSLV